MLYCIIVLNCVSTAVAAIIAVTLGEIVSLLESFKAQPSSLVIPSIPENSFAKKLYSTYLSYLPSDKVCFDLKMNCDDRGSFTELLKTVDCGQVSINISKPGITKGQHWHNTKWEFFIVIAGHGLIQERKIGTDEVLEFEVTVCSFSKDFAMTGWRIGYIFAQEEIIDCINYINEAIVYSPVAYTYIRNN